MSKILEKGTVIKFKSISEFTGKEIQLTGKVVGDDEAVRKRWPEEMAEALGCHLVVTMDNFGNINHHAVFDAEIISIIKKKEKFTGFSDLKVPELSKRDPNEPIFYHSTNCQCKKCCAKRRDENLQKIKNTKEDK